MSEFITATKRTHYCGDLRASHAGAEVTLMGWVQKRRDLGNLIFIDLRDREGYAQLVFNPEKSLKAHEEAHKIRSEFVIAITGLVQKRPEEMVNKTLKTGEIEVEVTDLEILNEAKTTPFQIESRVDVSENLLLTYRYLDLRRASLQKNLILRSKIAWATRNYLHKKGFIEVETPFLTKSTPEGARDYLVPSRVNPGMFYALPQSPQIFKQLLMVSGFDKYYQIVKCFRDEDLRADRQPEFTQIDIEMSFISENDIIEAMEGLITHIFKAGLDIELSIPFQRLTYTEAMNRYGKDSPDIRFGLELKDISAIVKNSGFKVFADTIKNGGIVKAIATEKGKEFSRKDLDEFGKFVATYGAKGLVWARVNEDGWTSSIAKFMKPEEINEINKTLNVSPDSVILIVADSPKIVHDSLGNLRVHIAQKLGLIDKNSFAFTWVTEFPMFEYSETEQRFMATHHPFTSPVMEDVPLLQTDPGKVRARAYDLVLNGSEIGGGSIRIHRSDIQSMVFDTLGLTQEEANAKFGFLLEALQYGTPPHGGLAFGFDRIMTIMSGADSIRDVIAFPKTQKASCLLTDAPSQVSEGQLLELSLKTI